MSGAVTNIKIILQIGDCWKRQTVFSISLPPTGAILNHIE